MMWFFLLALLLAVALYASRNALLASQRPALSRAASRAAGVPVSLSSVSLDGSLNVLEVAGAVTLGGGARLVIDRARVTGLRRGNREALVLEELEGTLRVDDPRGEATVPLSLRGGTRDAKHPLAGDLAVRGARGVHRASGQEMVLELAARLEFTGSAWTLSRMRVTGHGATAQGDLSSLALAPEPRELAFIGRVDGIGAELVQRVMCVVDAARPPLGLPGDLEVACELAIEPGGGGNATGQVRSGASQLGFRVQMDAAGALAATRVGGKVAASDLEALGLLGPLKVVGAAELAVDANLEGTLSAIAARVELYCPSLQLRLPTGTPPQELAIENLTARLASAVGASRPVLEALTGTVTLAGARGTASATVALGAAGSLPEGAWFDGELRVTDGKLAPRRPPRSPWPPFEARAALRVTGDGWTLKEVAGRLGEIRAEGDLAGAPGAAVRGTVQLDGLGADTLADLLRDLAVGPNLRVMHPRSPPGGFAIPPDLRVGARVTLSGDGSPGVNVTLGTDTSGLFLTGLANAQAPAGWKLSGRLSTRDINVMEWFAPMVLEAAGECFMEFEIESGRGGLKLVGRASSPRFEVRAFAGRPTPAIPVTDLSARLAVSGDEMTWTDLVGRAYDGRITCSGWMDFTSDPFPYRCRVDWSELSLAGVPAGSAPGQRVGTFLEAVGTGNLAFEGRGSDLAVMKGEGELVLAAPRYLFLRDLESTLATYGLPVPPLRGTAPCRMLLGLGASQLRLRNLDAKVEGLSVSGDVGLGFDGSLRGALEVEAHRSYLGQSQLLMLTAAVAKSVQVPVTLSGTMSDPKFSADLQGTLGNFMKNYKFGSITQGVAKSYEFGSLTRGILNTIDRLRPGERIQPGPELDRMFERILAGGAGASELMDQLANSGVAPNQLQTWLSDYRRRRDRKS